MRTCSSSVELLKTSDDTHFTSSPDREFIITCMMRNTGSVSLAEFIASGAANLHWWIRRTLCTFDTKKLFTSLRKKKKVKRFAGHLSAFCLHAFMVSFYVTLADTIWLDTTNPHFLWRKCAFNVCGHMVLQSRRFKIWGEPEDKRIQSWLRV